MQPSIGQLIPTVFDDTGAGKGSDPERLATLTAAAANDGLTEEGTGHWQRSATKSVTFLEARSARIVGVTGLRSGVGVSTFAAALSQAYAQFGRKVLLADASSPLDGTHLSLRMAAEPHMSVSLAPRSRQRDGVFYVDLIHAVQSVRDNTKAIRGALLEASETFDVIVVDLPPPSCFREGIFRVTAAAATACDVILLMCVAGETRKAELRDCIRHCAIRKLNIAGLVLNDAKLRFGRFLGQD